MSIQYANIVCISTKIKKKLYFLPKYLIRAQINLMHSILQNTRRIFVTL